MGKPAEALQRDYAEMIAGLNELLQLDHDAVGAYEVAIETLDDRTLAQRIELFREDHQRHIRELNDVILELGGTPANEAHATAPLKQAVQRIASSGGDDALLAAWRNNEQQISAEYDSYARKATGWAPQAKKVIDRAALDEGRHLAWVNELISRRRASAPPKGARSPEPATVKSRPLLADHSEVNSLDRLRARVSDGLNDAAASLKGFAAERGWKPGMAGKLAGGAQKAAETLDDAADGVAPLPGGPVDQAEEFIRRSPGKALTATFAVAFIAGRVIRRSL